MSSVIRLVQVPEGSVCVVRGVEGSSLNASRLRELGFICDAKVTVLRSDKRGLLVGVNDARFALSKDVACQIIVAQ